MMVLVSVVWSGLVLRTVLIKLLIVICGVVPIGMCADWGLFAFEGVGVVGGVGRVVAG